MKVLPEGEQQTELTPEQISDAFAKEMVKISFENKGLGDAPPYETYEPAGGIHIEVRRGRITYGDDPAEEIPDGVMGVLWMDVKTYIPKPGEGYPRLACMPIARSVEEWPQALREGVEAMAKQIMYFTQAQVFRAWGFPNAT